MNTQKVSVSISQPLYDFITRYQQAGHYKSRSEVIAKALRLLQQTQLEVCYREANAEIDSSFEASDADGLDDETW